MGRLCRKLILFNLDLQMSQNDEIDLKAFLFIKTHSQKIVNFLILLKNIIFLTLTWTIIKNAKNGENILKKIQKD